MNLQEILTTFPTEAEPHLVKLLDHLAHEMNGPLSTLSLELHMARHTLQREGPQGAATAVRDQLQNLDEILENVERANTALAELARALTRPTPAT